MSEPEDQDKGQVMSRNQKSIRELWVMCWESLRGDNSRVWLM